MFLEQFLAKNHDKIHDNHRVTTEKHDTTFLYPNDALRKNYKYVGAILGPKISFPGLVQKDPLSWLRKIYLELNIFSASSDKTKL